MTQGVSKMGVHILDIYRTSSIGIFLRSNDKHLLIPPGISPSKTKKLGSYMDATTTVISIAGSRLLGPLSVMNGKGVVISKLAEDVEIDVIKRATGLRVERLSSQYTSVGNLVAANDNGAVVSKILGKEAISEISEVLDVPVKMMEVASYVQVGSVITASNAGAIVHPGATEEQVGEIEDILKVEVEPATVNRGVPLVSSGAVLNSKNMMVGSLTSGPELMILGRAMP